MLESVIGVLAKVPSGIPETEAITGAESETVNSIQRNTKKKNLDRTS